MPETNDRHRELARQIIASAINLRSDTPEVNMELLPEVIASALSSRDAEVREVLEGLGKSIGDTWCWCSKPARDGNGSLIHFAACLATRALWEKVQER